MVDQTGGAPPARTRTRDRALAVAGAVVAAVVVWVVGEPLFGQELVVEQPGQEPRDLGAGAFLIFSLLSALLGWALLAVLEKVTPHAARISTAVAVVVLVLSFLPVVSVEASGGAKAVLALAHLAVGAVLIPLFWRTTRETAR